MTYPGSLRLSHDTMIRSYNGNCGFCHPIRADRLCFVTINPLQHGLRKHSSALLLSRVNAPLRPVPSRCGVLLCQAALVPAGGCEAPLLKLVSISLTRSYNAISTRPVVLQLIPALGIIGFAFFGLEPLLHLTRTLFLQERTDKSWKKSTPHYIMTSYFQPLLLWTGLMLICRDLDPLVLQSETSQVMKQRLLGFVRSLSTVLTFAYCSSSLIQQAQKLFKDANDSSDAKNMNIDFISKAVYTAIWVAAVSLFMESLGFSTRRLLTAGGLGTVLLSLSGREIFTNFLSSVMIHATRPFVENERIQTNIKGYEVSGKVEHVGWWSPTRVRGSDCEAVHIPNHRLSVNVVRNLSKKSHWRIKTRLAISQVDVNKINGIVADMRKVLAKNPQVEQKKLHRRVFLDDINPENQALMILISCFVKTSHSEEYLRVKETILLDLLRVISHHGARLATPVRTVQNMSNDAELEFDDTTFTGSRAMPNQPIIEASYKVKPSTHSTITNEKIDAKVGGFNVGSDNIAVTLNPAPTVNSKDKLKPTGEAKTQNMGSDNVVQKSAKSMHPKKKRAGSSGNTSLTSPSKQDEAKSAVSSSSVSPLENNIVLNAALLGSKGTLAIDEENIQSIPSDAESQELVVKKNGSVPPK
ncbi:PREDICTED: mechanosensitive ion channel protein 2, chloroplastic-like isoform X3 [Lupinus angustifolius]|uniref:mechanosensitive ion channel protein 2, chloroplastic-like isoform X3 n=1 Tax=Lupinus angustifolius TaxID=3871 RepID=UPI00092F0C89|nr:PREDICTED: mechanosensitive ion channel protein 2, chloroplastic-like isoform X3 [Lupinus angustifolius]